jgi:hypothetical protein
VTKVMVPAAAAFGLVLLVLWLAVCSWAFAAFMAGDQWSHPDPDRLTNDVPATTLEIYRLAEERTGVPWQVLAGVGKVECDHNRNPACGTPNVAGAVGPMQFLPGTFQRWAHASGSAAPSILDERDAVFAAAAKLAADGINSEPRRALHAYNHSDRYVATVEAWAVGYGWEPDAEVLAWAVTHHPNISLRPAGRVELDRGDVDPRVSRLLLIMATRHRLGSVGPIRSGHRELVAGTDRRSNHSAGRAVDIPTVDGKPVSVDNNAARDALDLALKNAGLPENQPSEVGAPWDVDVLYGRSFTAGHADHLHFGWDQ